MVFLEKDNLKLLSYEVGGLKSAATRLFAGQITFSPEVLRDGFIADAAKFSGQVKMAFAQKDQLRDAAEVLLFVSPDKVFTKTLPAADSVDIFIHGLPYFKEELVINTEESKVKGKGDRVTYTAFEKKLVEDLERPFQELGKKIIGVKSPANALVEKFPQAGKYLFLIPQEREIVMVAAENGEILDLAVVKNDVFVARLEEFRANHDLGNAPTYSVGVFPSHFNLQTVNLAQTDIYDLIVNSSSTTKAGFELPLFLNRLNPRYLFLIGAATVGILLVLLIVKNLHRLPGLGRPAKTEITSPVAPTPPPPPAPEPKPADYPVEILNGTLITGEAGKLADKLKAEGFDITDTKNATSAGFAATRLRATKEVPDKILTELKTTLLETYESVTDELLATPSGKADIQIIIGKKKT